jgi:hypothetical protein
MSQDYKYAQMLRPIGQVLEKHGIESYSVTMDGSDIVVLGHHPMKPQEAPPGFSLKSLCRLFGGGNDPDRAATQPSTTVELRYTPAEVARLDAECRNQRRSSGAAPEPHSPSQILRAAGSFVDQKEGRLLAVTKEGPKIILAYESAAKGMVSEQFSASELYDFWVKMYLKRGQHPPR